MFFLLCRREPQLNTPTSFVPTGNVCRNGLNDPEWWLCLWVISGHFVEFLNGHLTIRDEDEGPIYVSTIFHGYGDRTFADGNLTSLCPSKIKKYYYYPHHGRNNPCSTPAGNYSLLPQTNTFPLSTMISIWPIVHISLWVVFIYAWG